MTAVLAYLRQPTTLLALGMLLGAAVYWFTGNPTLAAIAFSVIPGAVSEQGQATLTKIETIEDTVKPMLSGKSGTVLKLLPLFLAVALSACGGSQASSSIAGLESALIAADDAALVYEELPRCNLPNATGPCSQPMIVAQIHQAAASAYQLIKQAEASNAAGATPDLTAAQTAMAAYAIIITSTKGI